MSSSIGAKEMVKLDDEGELSLSRLSQPSFDDEEAARGSVPRATAPPNGEKDDLTSGLDVPPRPSDAFETQASSLHSKEPVPVDGGRPPTPPNRNDHDNGQETSAETVYKLPDIVDELGREPDQWTGSHMAVEDSPALPLTTLSPVEVRTRYRTRSLVDN